MKKLFITVAAAAMIFTSCKKYEVSEEINLESLPTVAIKGTVYAVLDETVSAAEYQFAPQGTVVRVSIPYEAYDIHNTSNGFYVKTTTIDSNGNYEIDVPVVSRGVEATVSFTDFTYNVKTQNGVGQEIMVLKHFNCPDRVVAGLGAGQAEGDYIEIDAIYGANAVDPNENALVPTKTVTVSGKMEYYSKVDNACNEINEKDVPAGTKVMAIITLSDPNSYRMHQVTQTVTIGASGVYEIQVPMADRCVATIDLYAEEYWTVAFDTPACGGSTSTNQLWRFELVSAISAYDTPIPQTKKNFFFNRKNYVTDL